MQTTLFRPCSYHPIYRKKKVNEQSYFGPIQVPFEPREDEENLHSVFTSLRMSLYTVPEVEKIH